MEDGEDARAYNEEKAARDDDEKDSSVDDLTDDEHEDEDVLVAMAPKAFSAADDNLVMEASASPAFQCLEDLFQEGKLSGTKVAVLKSKYIELHETLKRSWENERDLLNEAKALTKKLDEMNFHLSEGDAFPEGVTSEAGKLRQELLKHHNELALSDDRLYQMMYKIESLKEEKVLLEKEYTRKPKAGEREKQIKDLQQTIEDLKKEILKNNGKKVNLKEDLNSKNEELERDNRELQELRDKLDELKAELVQVGAFPGQVAKDTDKLLRQKKEIDSEHELLNNEYKEMVQLFKTLEKKRQQLEEEKFEENSEFEKRQSLQEIKERQLNFLIKDHEYAKERETMLITERAALDQNIRHNLMEKKLQHEILSRKTREKDKDLKTLKRLDLQLKNAEDSLNHTNNVYNKIKGNLDILPKDDGTLKGKLVDLQKEVDQIKRNLATQNSLTAVEHVKLEASAAEEQELMYEQSDLRIEVIELARLAQIKADERESKARDFMRAEMRFHRTLEDLKSRQIQISDHQKKLAEVQLRLQEFAKLYDIIKSERNKCVGLIQQSTQKSAEMREKLRINANEVEILRTAATYKEKKLQKMSLKRMNSIVIRDSLRNEVTKQQNILDNMRAGQDQQKMDITRINQMINHAEEEMVKLRKSYESAVQHRNKSGIDLIERNEEVCIFFEKVNIQDLMLRNGNIELQAKEEQIRFIKIKLDNLKRSVNLLQKTLPNKRQVERDLVSQQIQLAICHDDLKQLETKVENPAHENRVRFLEDVDLEPAELKKKTEDLESNVALKEELLLEKDLILEQVSRLLQQTEAKKNAGKADTLELAKRVIYLQRRIKSATRKMMALVAELSMNQANSLKYQQELKEKHDQLENCYIKMEKGEAPDDEAEREWLRYLKNQSARQKDLIKQQEEEEESDMPVRYNAYIPDDESDLPIARPYGKHAPFQQSKPGSHIRHYRKPILKPIEI